MSDTLHKPTIHDIARELNVTFSTVARALNDHPAISTATKEAVRETAKRLGYRQNKLASSLRSGRSNVIGIMVPSIDVSFFGSVVHGIEQVMNENGYNILLYQSKENIKQEAKGLETFLQSRVDGIISSISLESAEQAVYAELIDRKVPLLFFDRALNELPVPSVTIDDYKGGFIATEHLIKKGYSQIVHISSDMDLLIFKERFRGYAEALKHYGLPFREELVFRGKVSLEFGRQCIRKLLDDNISFDAVFSMEDYTAMGALQELMAAEIKVPEEVGVIGFANEAFGAYITPTLSTIDQQAVRMGRESASLFLKLLKNPSYYTKNPEKIVLEPLLQERATTAAGKK